MRFTTKDFTTNWTRLEVGIVMGCTVSPVLFVLSMQLFLKATESKSNFVDLGRGCQMPPVKAFINDNNFIIQRI